MHAEPSHWLHEISISKTVRHHFWPGLILPQICDVAEVVIIHKNDLARFGYMLGKEIKFFYIFFLLIGNYCINMVIWEKKKKLQNLTNYIFYKVEISPKKKKKKKLKLKYNFTMQKYY